MRGKELQPLQDLLARFKNLKPPQKAVIDVFCSAVNAACGVSISKKVVRYTVASRTIGITMGGPLKSEVAQRRSEILQYCVRELGAHAPKDIV